MEVRGNGEIRRCQLKDPRLHRQCRNMVDELGRLTSGMHSQPRFAASMARTKGHQWSRCSPKLFLSLSVSNRTKEKTKKTARTEDPKKKMTVRSGRFGSDGELFLRTKFKKKGECSREPNQDCKLKIGRKQVKAATKTNGITKLQGIVRIWFGRQVFKK